MQKVRSRFLIAWAAYKTTISKLSLTVLFSVTHVLYLAFEEGSPQYSNSFKAILLILIGCSIFVHTNHRISFDFFSWS
jgi:hypothetical protein